MLTSWKKRANALSTAAWRTKPSEATASRSATREPPVRASRADPLLVLEQVRPVLLDEHPAEQIAEQAHVGTERAVGGHVRSLCA
jgi:hypothetical protein